MLTPLAVAALERQRLRQAEQRAQAGERWQEQELVFTNRVGKPVDPWGVDRRHFYPLLERAGLPRIRFHELRHTTGALLISLGVPLSQVQRILGHGQISVTADIYGHVMPEMQRDAMGRLNAALGGEVELSDAASATTSATASATAKTGQFP